MLSRALAIFLVAAAASPGCGTDPGAGQPVDVADILQGYTRNVRGHCVMDARRETLTDGIFVEHLPPRGFYVRSYLGCEFGSRDVEATPASLTATVANSWDDIGCWVLVGPVDAPEPFEMRANTATGTLVYDLATDSVQLDVVYEGMWGGVPRTMTCTHYAEH
jgi:hypothetical protein